MVAASARIREKYPLLRTVLACILAFLAGGLTNAIYYRIALEGRVTRIEQTVTALNLVVEKLSTRDAARQNELVTRREWELWSQQVVSTLNEIKVEVKKNSEARAGFLGKPRH